MVKIRLTRIGKRHQPQYRIIAADSRSPRDGKFLEILGSYNPRTKPSTITLEKEKIEKWLKSGAQPTETVANILFKEGILKPKAKTSPVAKAKKSKISKKSSSSKTTKAKKVSKKSSK